MKAMYIDSCLLQFSQNLILFQSIAKCCCSLVSDFVAIQSVQVINEAAIYFDSCLLETSQRLVLLQSNAKCCDSLVSNVVVTQAGQVTNYEGNVH